MKILVVGASGLVGSRFVELYFDKDKLLIPDRDELDLLDASGVKAYFGRNKPNVVVNFAAYTNVSEGENQRDDRSGSCWQLNVSGVENLLGVIGNTKIFLVQISTDNVFSGFADDSGPYPENHPPEADSKRLTWYGFTKAEAERAIIKELRGKAAILRVIYPVRSKFEKKLDYLRKPLRFLIRAGSIPYLPTSRSQLPLSMKRAKRLRE